MQTADSRMREYFCTQGILSLEGRASIGSHATAKLTAHLLRRIVRFDEQARAENRRPLRQFVDASTIGLHENNLQRTR